ncbi:MAG TPA: peptidoglycan DD-metalloendopeptidase family protein [Candidatus Dormibacteraeota bacterium]|nr:peptidoglycan DD-metalloendopeptidase family protein [Candidatus Dormibacteraeota bacterium]
MRKLLLAFALVVLALTGAQAGVSADATAPDPTQQQAVIDQVRTQLGSNLADALAAQDQLRQSLQDNAAQQQTVQGQIVDVEAKIAALDVQITAAQQREAYLALRIDAERAQLTQLARAIYVAPTSVLVVLGEAQSLSDLLSRIADLNVAGARASEVKRSLAMDLVEQQVQRKREQDARAAQVIQQDQLDLELAQLKVLQAQQEQSMADLDTKIAQTRYELWRLNTQSAQLAQQITDMLTQQEDALIAAAMQAVWTQVQLWTQSNNVGQIATSAGHSTKYRFIWPEPQAQISQPFGPSQLALEPPYAGYPHFHTGIDLVEPFGSPVYAADDGVVALVGSTTSGYGNYIVIAHTGGLDTLYGHLSAALVKAGQTVSQGQTIGLEGSTGNSTGPHLHFELRINQKPVDPTLYLPPGAPSSYKL